MTSVVLLLACISFVLFVAVVATNNTVLVVLMFIALAADGPGAEAIVVSHQLPIWVTRLSAEDRPLWHDPRQRQCSLTSVTSLHFERGQDRPRIEYQEPNKALLKDALNLPGA